MEQPFSTSKVTVEYFDPHDVFKLLAPGLVPRLPLRNLHWQSHAGPLRSIETLHVELLPSGDKNPLASPLSSPPPSSSKQQQPESDGFQTQIGAVAATRPSEIADQSAHRSSVPTRRHQIPGLRRTPYLKVLLVRCDDNDSYKGHVRQEIRDWIKVNTVPSTSKKANAAENHDAFEWLIVHVVIPNTVAATQPRKSDVGAGSDKSSAASRWRPGSSTLLEKLRSDFNSSNKSAMDHVSQIRIGVNDVPYDILPRVVPAVPSGYTETEQETENAWTDLIAKFRSLILSSFDMRVTQYEEDIKEKDAQRSLPGWNFCTFFILKEGLARGFESVGLVEDALVGYDELSVGLDMIIKDQSLGRSGSAANALPAYTEDLKKQALKARAVMVEMSYEEDEVVDMEASQLAGGQPNDSYDDIPITANKKPYRDLIVANNVSIFDFRCYIFARQIALLLRLGNAWSTREELLAKLKEQQESVLHGVAPRAPPPKHKENEQEELPMLAEICRRALDFIPSVSQVMRNDLLNALSDIPETADESSLGARGPGDPVTNEIVDNLVVSFAFSTAQQILAQTSTKALPIPSSSLEPTDGDEPKAAIPEPKTMMHPARSSSLNVRPGGAGVPRPPPSPNVFSGGQAQNTPGHEATSSSYLKDGLENLAARRAELYALSRNILEESGKKRGWSNGWAHTPVVSQSTMINMVDIDLGDDEHDSTQPLPEPVTSMSGIDNKLLKTALDNSDDFYRLYEILTDKALRHYTVANHTHSMQSTMADLAVLKYHLKEYSTAAYYFWMTTPFFGESGWSLLELSMLIMYSRCLKQLQRKDDHVKVLLKLLSKAAAAEKDRRRVKPSLNSERQDYPESEEIKGLLDELLLETKAIPNEMRIPLSNFFSSIEIDGTPQYDDGRDSLALHLNFNSLLLDDLVIDSASVRIVNASSKPSNEIRLTQDGPITIRPGNSKLKLKSNVSIAGSYEIDRIALRAGKLCLYFEREIGYPSHGTGGLLKSPHVSIYYRADTLDVRLSASKCIQLDRNNSVDIELDTGWNSLNKAEIRVKAATGGLRLLTSEAKRLDSTSGFSRPPEGGVFWIDSTPAKATIRIQFPYTLEQDTPSISIRIEVSYETEHGNYFFSKTPVVHTSLALGVNVQDVFKHNALFSRFTVSTASSSPIRLLKNELLGSDTFECTSGAQPGGPVMVFPRQPASLLYRITRKSDVKIGPNTSKTMYLKLHYSLVYDEIEALFENSLAGALKSTPLRPLSRLLVSSLLPLVRSNLTGTDLERTALRGLIHTTFLVGVDFARMFHGLGKDDAGIDLAQSLATFLRGWQADNPTLSLLTLKPAEPSSILIPVDIPSVTIVHTADIKLQPQPTIPTSMTQAATPAVYTHQLIPATLHLRWTRLWDTLTPPLSQADLEFSYEISAPTDTWLVGGRRRGHFVIPAPDSDDESQLSSSIDTEAEIPLLLIPLREGWLPYPGVDIREVRSDLTPGTVDSKPGLAPGARPGPEAQYETDVRNIGETVHVVADRCSITVSLDASGPAGGPLVLDVERADTGVRVLVQ
ncbi:putative cis-Golgi transport protein particle complex subunit [Rosellinia necatrix]|uniref:Putative cis-Golgi transport protein particle complex subunit n=1 Tax=Rosellinia necatrix TaxID=77044 RepID=A0A1W2TTZ1_ROSNE|nr:putative cis-Golgi transport protein particle complex subunit [Rosellinia necatrix]